MAAALPPGMDLSKIPLMPNPSGAPPNFVNPPDLMGAVLGVGIALMVLSGILLIFRLVTNYKISRITFDDYLCIFAQGGGMAYWILYHMISSRGTSRHAWDVPMSVITVSYIKLQASIQIVIAPAIWAAKAAILALYIRLFGTVHWLKITCYVWIGLMALFYGSNIVVSVVYCIPRKGEAWDGTSFARCGTSAWSAVVIGVFSTVADVVIFVLPFPILIKLRVNPAKKIGLILLFLTGFILVILSVLSLVFRTMIFRGTDVTWYGTSTGILTFAELFGTIIVSCAPALSAFWFKIFTKSSLWSSLISSRKTQNSDAVLPTNLHFDFASTSILKDDPKASSDDAPAKPTAHSGNIKNEKPMPYMAPWKDNASTDREIEKTQGGPLVSVRDSDGV